MKMLKQAQEMQSKMQEMQDKLNELEVTGQSGGGLVQVTMNGKRDIVNCKIDPSLVNKDEVEILEDLIVAAMQDAAKKAESQSQDQMSEITDGLSLPEGFKLPF